MKKRTIKDFIALYNSEEEEKLVLIQSGTCADKTGSSHPCSCNGRRAEG